MDIAAGAPFPPAPPPTPEVSGRPVPWTPKDVLVGLLLFIGTFLVLPLPVAVPLALFFEADSRPFLIVSIAVSVPIYLAIAGIAARMTFLKYRGGWIMLGMLPATRRTLGWALVAFLAALAVSFAYGWFIQIPGLEFLHQKCADQVPESIRSDRLLLAMSGVLAVLFAPVCEELYFRGFVFPGLARAWGPAAGIAASGILFGSAHMLGNPALYKSVIQFSAIGIVFAFAYWKSGNIISTILAHFTFNLMGIILIASTTCHD